MNEKRLKKLALGNRLLIFFMVVLFAAGAWFLNQVQAEGFKTIWNAHWGKLLLIYFFELVIFWWGIILVYVYSVQLGLKLRIIGILLGPILGLDLLVLAIILFVTESEFHFEKKKLSLNKSRKNDSICKTKYPLLLVHGVFFRDSKILNYWGRIPDELTKNGATIFYGEHVSASSAEDCAKELCERIKKITEETGCQKVNIIAHSKGGIDSKYAIAKLGIAEYVASLTTINTPHKGCEFADYLLGKASNTLKETVAAAYNSAAKKLGDKNPSFIAAVTDLTQKGCEKINEQISGFDFASHGVYTQSVGSVMKKLSSGKFPLNMSYHLVKHFDGANDGLVGEKSFPFGEKYIFLENKKSKRGISHGDVIDLCRENIPGFDVREFYVGLVADLKNRGL